MYTFREMALYPKTSSNIIIYILSVRKTSFFYTYLIWNDLLNLLELGTTNESLSMGFRHSEFRLTQINH